MKVDSPCRSVPLVALLAWGAASGCGELDLEEAIEEKTSAVYGEDSRKEFLESTARMQGIARSTAILSGNLGITCDSLNCAIIPGLPGFKDPKTGNGVFGLCPDEKFGPSLANGGIGQATMNSAFCSGFLVGSDLMVSAGHCFIAPDEDPAFAQQQCPAVKVVFDFNADSFGNTPIGFPAANVRTCKTVLGVKNSGGEDWIVFRLDAPVPGRSPLPIRRTGRVASKENLAIAGHPSFLPMKTAGSGTVIENNDALTFKYNLDVFNGNSGGPIINRDTEVVEGICSIGPNDKDYKVFDHPTIPGKLCLRANRCDATVGCEKTPLPFDIAARTRQVAAKIPSLAPRTFDTSTYVVNGTYIPLSGDFDGNGDADVVWYRPGNDSEKVWWSNGVSKTFDTDEPFDSVSGTYVPIVGDFDGDRTADIFWYRAGSGSDTIAYGGRNRIFDERSDSVDGTYTTAAGDFNGDGRTDILWHRPGADSDYISYFTGDRSNPYADDEFNVDGTYTPIVGDFNGDGRADIFWYRPSGTDKVWYFNADTTHSEKSVTVDATFKPFAGDFDGDGFSDIFWYAPGSAADFISYGNAAKTFPMTPTSVEGTYVVNVGDYNGDSVSDILWYRAGEQEDYIDFYRIK